MFSKQKLTKLLGNDDYFLAQYFGHGFAGKLQAWIFRSRPKILTSILRGIRSKPKKTLDVGCGPMFISHDLIGNEEGEYVGLDIMSRDRLKRYRDVMRDMTGGAIEAVRASGELLPFRDDAFDFAISLDVLEHLKNPRKCAIELARTAERNGVIAISLPLENSFQKLLRIGFLPLRIAGDPTLKGVKLNVIVRWIFETPPYHYCGNIKSYDAMTGMLEEFFSLLHVEYAPLGHAKSINVSAVLFFLRERMAD